MLHTYTLLNMEYKAKLTEKNTWEIEKDSHQDTNTKDFLNIEGNTEHLNLSTNKFKEIEVITELGSFTFNDHTLKVVANGNELKIFVY